jgi:hypothetical protein
VADNARKKWHYVVGDIHGCYDALRRLEDRIVTHAREHGVDVFIVCVGDLVDRGPMSKEVVAHVRRGVRMGTHVCVAGNHEGFMAECVLAEAPWNFPDALPVKSTKALYTPGLEIRYLMEGKPQGFSMVEFREMCLIRWLKSGGRETLLSFGCDPEDPGGWRIDPELLSFLVDLPFIWENDSLVVTHALARKEDLILGRQLYTRALLSPKTFHDTLNLNEAKTLEGLLWTRELPFHAPDPRKVHVTGHTPLERPFKDANTGVINVDTACVFGNMLTAYCVESGDFLSVQGWMESPFR